MSQTIEAVIDENGAVRLLKPIHLTGSRRALVTILEDRPAGDDELEAGYRAMAEDELRETEALDIAEATIGDVSDERGEVWWINFDASRGGDIKKTRPAIIVSNDISNKCLN